MLTSNAVAVRVIEEFDEMVSETAVSDYSVNEVDLGEIEIKGKTVTVYLGLRQND